MTNPGGRQPVVLDASAGIQFFVQEAETAAVETIFTNQDFDPPLALHIPDLFFIECANILLKYSRRFGRPFTDTVSDVQDLANLALIITSTADLMVDAVAFANQHNLTAYDACYAVLALRLHAPLLTVDSDLLNLNYPDLNAQTPSAFLHS